MSKFQKPNNDNGGNKGEVKRSLKRPATKDTPPDASKSPKGSIHPDMNLDQFDPQKMDLTAFHVSHGQHLFLVMRALASQWSDHARSRTYDAADLTDEFPTWELIEVEAEAQACTIFRHEKALSSLKQQHCPAILALDNNLCLLLLAVADDGSLVIETPKGDFVRLEAHDLARTYSGLFYALQPDRNQEVQLDGETASKPHEHTSHQGYRSEKDGLLQWLIEHVWKANKVLLIQLMIAAGISNLLMIALPIFIMSVYDRVIPHFATETLWTLSIGVLLAMAIDLGLRYVRLNLADAIGLAASVKLQSRLYKRLTRMPLKDAPRTPGGLADTLREMEGLCLIGPSLLVALSIDLPFVILIIALIAYLGGAAVWGAITGGIVIALMLGYGFRVSRKNGQQDARLLHQKTNQMAETIEALEAVKATGSQNRLLANWERLTDNQAITSHHARLHNTFAMQATMAASQLAIVLTVMIGVYQIGNSLMTVGNLAASILLVGRVIAPTSNIVSLLGRASMLSSILQKAQRLMEASEEAAGDTTRQPLKKHAAPIAFNNVSFQFEGSEQRCLDDICLTIKPGEKVGIIGRNGSGKSTLLRMIPRFLEPTAGTILFDHFNLKQYDPMQLRRTMAYMPQDNILFDRSLRDNICLGIGDVESSRLFEVGKITGLNEFIATHPQGYGLMVGPRGERLSGGERQAVCLARTLIDDAPILLLDEPTSAMDNSLEAHFVRACRGEVVDKTLVLTTHRTHLLKLVDRVIWLDKGKVIADGPRDKVLSSLKRNA